MTDRAETKPLEVATTLFIGGTAATRTAAIVDHVAQTSGDDHRATGDRSTWIVARSPGRVDDGDPNLHVVTPATLARRLVEAEAGLVAAVPDLVIGSELARRTLVVEAVAATNLEAPWRLAADGLLESSVRVLDGLAEAGIPVVEAVAWQSDELDRLDRRNTGDDAASHGSLQTLRQIARRRLDLLAVASTYERLKRERSLLDRTDVFRRASWLAERGCPWLEDAPWSAIAVDGLDRFTAEEHRLIDALRRGGVTIAACSVSHSDHHLWPADAEIVDLGDSALPCDPIEQALLAARSGVESTTVRSHGWPGVRAEVFVDESAEDRWLVDSIARALDAGVDPGEIAVVAISAERLPAIERRMLDRSIPCRRLTQPLGTGTTATGDLLAVADLLVDPNDAVATTRLARSPRYVPSRGSVRNPAAPAGAAAIAVDLARWLRTAAERGPQHALVDALRDLGIERVLAISHERWAAGELRAVRAELDYLDDPAHGMVTRSAAAFRIALRSIVGPHGARHRDVPNDRAEGHVSLVAADQSTVASGSWDHVYLVGLSDEAIGAHHRLEDETSDPASLPLALLGDPLEVPLGAGGRTVEVLGRRMRRRREDNADAWLVELARSARTSLSLSDAVAPRRSADVHETGSTESRFLGVLHAAGLGVRRRSEDTKTEGAAAPRSGEPRQLAPPQGTSLLLIEGGIAEAVASHPQSARIRDEVDELVAYLTPGTEEECGAFAPRELSARELFLAETDPDRYVQEVMLDLPEPPSLAADRTARLRAWLELDAARRTDVDGHGVLVSDGSITHDPIEQMSLLRGVDDRDLDLPGIGSDAAVANLVQAYRATPYGSMILNDGGRSLVVISQGRLVHSRLFGVIDQPDGIWQVIDVRVGAATELDWYRLGIQALALSSPSRSLGCCRLVVVGLDSEANIEVRPSPSADHLTRRLALQWQIVDLVGS